MRLWNMHRKGANLSAQGAAVAARSSVPEHMSPLAAHLASERVATQPRHGRLWLLKCSVQLETNIICALRIWRQLSFAFDMACLSALVVSPVAPAPVAALSGRSVLPISPLWARYVHWFGRLAFDTRWGVQNQPLPDVPQELNNWTCRPSSIPAWHIKEDWNGHGLPAIGDQLTYCTMTCTLLHMMGTLPTRRKHKELQRRALWGNDVQAARFAREVHKRISLATHTEVNTAGATEAFGCHVSTLRFLVAQQSPAGCRTPVATYLARHADHSDQQMANKCPTMRRHDTAGSFWSSQILSSIMGGALPMVAAAQHHTRLATWYGVLSLFVGPSVSADSFTYTSSIW
jgi:hypothetical protein